MKTTIKSILSAVALSLSASAMAQQLSSSYFMEGSLYRHELNPAFMGEQNYVGMPLLGNLTFGVNGNLGLDDVLFNKNGKTVTFLHPDVTLSEALDGINENNKYLMNMRMSIVSVGFKQWGGFNTIGLNLRMLGGVHFGDDIFELTKDLQNRSYNVGEFGMQAQAFAELALGHSRKFMDDRLSVGAKVKFLFGLGRLNAEMDDLTLNLENPNQWTATAHARVEANVTGIEITQKQEKYNTPNPDGSPRYYNTVDEFKLDNAGLGGFGMALDLGAEYDLKDYVPGLKASLAFLDLGFISWSESHVVENNGEDFQFDGFNNIKVKDSSNPGAKKLSDQTDDLADRLKELYRLENKGNEGGSTHGIGATMNIGVEYTLPMYKQVRFGLLSTTRFQGDYSWNEERVSVNYAPINWFEMSINGAVGTFGPSFGWMLNLHPTGFNFFIGMDHMMSSVAKPFVPLHSNADFTMGISFPLNAAPKKR